MTQKALKLKEKKLMSFIKIKNSQNSQNSQKFMTKKGKRQTVNWDIFVVHMSNKELTFRVYKELQLHKKNTNS